MVAQTSAWGVRRFVLAWVVCWWCLLAVVAAGWSDSLGRAWPNWEYAFGAGGAWGLNALLLIEAMAPPRRLTRIPILATLFAFFMTVLGAGSYWATVQLYPGYRVNIERAAWFVAVCTGVSLVAVRIGAALPVRPGTDAAKPSLVWDWHRVAIATYLLFGVSLVGTVMTLRLIGYVPVLTGDPTSARVEFPDIGGIWYRLSMLGGVAALLVCAQAAARRATTGLYTVGLLCLMMVGTYGPRFFVILPLSVGVLLWDRIRNPLPWRRLAFLFLACLPVLAAAAYWREQDERWSVLGPLGALLYLTLGEFRDLGWTLDYYEGEDRYLRGLTFASLLVPIMPAVVWNLLGVDKNALFAQNSATILAQQMGESVGIRVGAYGEFFMNFGWTGALVGAACYGLLLGVLDRLFERATKDSFVSLLVALAAATTLFAQIGQLNMFSATLSGFGYPLIIVALFAARRARSRLSHPGMA